MSQKWMIDVLTDLRSFAQQNGLLGLAEQLDDSIMTAATEMKTLSQISDKAEQHARQTGGVHRTPGIGKNI